MSEPPADPSRTRTAPVPPPAAVAHPTASGSTAPQVAAPLGADPDGEPALGTPAQPGELGRLGRYRVVRRLGVGGMGSVYLGHDETLDRPVAVKVMLPRFAANPAARARFLREARTAAQIRSEHVVAILDVDEIGGTPFIVMEYLHGVPLDRYLAANPGLSIPQVVRCGMEVARGLAAAHGHGLVHRDIKPSNLLLESPHGRVKILDFGLAKETDPAAGDDGVTRTGQILGTPAYMSPEQTRGVALDHRSDLFSLGVVLYKLATGRAPFTGPHAMAVAMSVGTDDPRPVRELNPGVPEPLAELIHRLLAKSPAHRPQTAADVHAALAAIEYDSVPEATAVEDEYVPIAVPVADASGAGWGWVDSSDVPLAHETAVPEAAPPRPKRRGGSPWLIACGAVAVLVGVGVIIGVLNKANRKSELVPAVEEKPPVPPRPKTPDRKAAEWVLSKPATPSGTPGVGVRRDGSDQSEFITSTANIPAGEFRVTSVVLPIDRPASNADLEYLRDLPALTHIEFRSSTVTDAGLEQLSLFPAAARYEHLGLASPNLTDAAMPRFDRFGALRSVRFAGNPQLTGVGIAALAQARPDLTALAVEGADVRNADLAQLKNFKKLERLALSLPRVTPHGLRSLAQLPNLKRLHLQGPGCNDRAIDSVLALPNLTELALSWSVATDLGLEKLAGMKSLRRLELSGTGKFTVDGLNTFRAARPDCAISTSVDATGNTRPVVFPPLRPDRVEAIRKLPPAEQVKTVGEELKARNPGFDPATLQATIADGEVVGLKLPPRFVTDLTPVRALPKLVRLDCHAGDDGGAVADLSPLAGLPLRELVLHKNRGVSDLSPLEGMPLATLDVIACDKLADLWVLQDMKVEVLKIHHSGVTDVSPLAGTPLREIHLNPTQVRHLSPLAKCPKLEAVRLDGELSKVTLGHRLEDLRPLQPKVENIPAEDFWPAWERRRDTAKLPRARKALDAHSGPARWVAFDAKGERLVSVGTDGKVRLWNPATGDEIRTIPPPGEKTHGQAAEFIPGSNLLVASYHDGVRFWNADTGEPDGGRLAAPDKFWCLALSPDGKTVAVNPATDKQPIVRYSVADRSPLPPLTGHTAGVQESAFSADSTLLASAAVGPDCSVRVWEMESGREVARLNRPPWDPNVSVAFARDGRVMFATSRGLVGFFDRGQNKVTLTLPWLPLGAAALHPDGTHLILGGADGIVTVMDAESGKVAAESNGGTRVWRIAVSPDGKTVATAHHDGKVRLWDWDQLSGRKP